MGYTPIRDLKSVCGGVGRVESRRGFLERHVMMLSHLIPR